MHHPYERQNMKRIIHAVAASLAFASASVYAQAQNKVPQPSFNDSAPIQSGPSSTQRTPMVKHEFPKPSFNDFEPLPAHSATSSATFGQQFPKGSMNGGGGPTGPASVVVQPSESPTQHAAPWPHPSFDG
jgi:hypothetical protein